MGREVDTRMSAEHPDGFVIRGFERGDLDAFHAFRRSADAVLAFGFWPPPRSRRQTGDLIRSITGAANQALWTLAGADDEPLGCFHLQNIDRFNRTVMVGMAIYDPPARGHGLGTRSRRVVLDLVFNEMNFLWVYGQYLDANDASRRLNEKLGAELIGRRRAAVFTGGRYQDMICHATSRARFNKVCASKRTMGQWTHDGGGADCEG
jgi:RimJ/RimL family protein N-acetyltransferase